MAREFICGFHCGILYASISASHWSGITGTNQSIVDNGDGTSHLLTDTTGGSATSYTQHTFSPATYRTKAVKFHFTPLVASSSDQAIITMLLNSGMRIYYQADGKLAARAVTGTIQTSPTALTIGRKYFVEALFQRSGGTATVDWRIDGVDMTQATFVTAAADMGDIRIGPDGACTVKYKIEDLVTASATSDYPSGEAVVRLFVPTTAGAHSFTAGDFQNEAASNIATGDTATWSRIDERPPTSTEFVQQVVIRSAGYLQYGFPTYGTPICVQVCASVHNVGTQANTQKAVLFDGTSTADSYALQITGSVAGTLRNIVGMHTAAPSGAWTQPLFEATEVRWGFSTDVTHVPALDALSLEAEFGADDPLPRSPYLPQLLPQ